MAWNSTGQSGSFHYLVEFLLDSTTLNYADEDLSLQMTPTLGKFYEGRLPRMGTLVRTLSTFLEPKESVDTFAVEVDNSDGDLQDKIKNMTFANREVRIYLGEDNVFNNYSRVFTGLVAHPNGISWDEDAAVFTVIDKRVKSRRVLPSPTQRFTASSYPKVESRSLNAAVPILFGDWTSGAVSGISVPCICTDTSIPKFKVCGHGLSGIDRYLKNAVKLNPVTQIQNVNLVDASFELNGVPYNVTEDTISVNCKGLYSANGTMWTKPGDILRSILTSYMDLTGTDLNVTAFNTLDTEVDTEKVRRYINREESSETLINELMNEVGADLRFVGGKYDPKYRTIGFSSERVHYRDVDIALADEQREKAAFRVENDPDRFFANRINTRYQFNPVDSIYHSSFVSSVTSSISEVTAVVERPMDFNWYYQQNDVEARAQRELVIFSVEPRVVDTTLTRRAMLRDLADQVDITYNIFDSKTFQVRRMETSLENMTTRILGYDLFSNTFGRWMADSAPNYNDATINQRAESGFWTTDTGFASPSDTDSTLSKWF